MSSSLSICRRLAAGAALLLTPLAVSAGPLSSHREAPSITKHPKVDGTDFYMFRSYESGRSGYVTLVANYIPLQPEYGGPNFFSMDPDALYEIHIDNNGDAKEDLTFQFRFTNAIKDTKLTIGGKQISVPLVNVSSIAGDADLNFTQSYSVTMVKGDRRAGTVSTIAATGGATSFIKPMDNIGAKSIADYDAYANQYIYNINVPGFDGVMRQGRVFVGQRKDPFVVALGGTFDLVNLNPLQPVNVPGSDTLSDANVTSIIMELPIAGLVASAGQPVIGGWTTASLRQASVLNPKATFDKPQVAGGAWTQVSRLGAPLVNELVIGLKDKDRFNSSQPKDDGQFADYVTNPTLPAIIEILFGGAGVKAPTLFPRADLVQIFLTGVTGLNQPTGVVGSEMLRLNTSTPAAAKGSQNNLGVIAGDNAGFPNGRRPGDDVVDIALRCVMGKLLSAADAPSGQLNYSDGAYVDDSYFLDHFPYLQKPLPGAGSN